MELVGVVSVINGAYPVYLSNTYLVFSDLFVRPGEGLERQRLIGSEVAGFNYARTITKAKGLYTRQDDPNKGLFSPGIKVEK